MTQISNNIKNKKTMKKQIIFLLVSILSFSCYSQIKFEKGYIIDNDNQKKSCLIKNLDWRNNPVEFEYKISENSEIKKATIKQIKEFGIDNVSKYVRAKVDMDRSSNNLNSISTDRNPIFKKEVLFLKVLVDGKSTLYEYVDENLRRYFYNKDNSPIKQLVYKIYKTYEDDIRKNERFKKQLLDDLKCPSIEFSKIKGLEYKKKSLVNFFVEYNTCSNQEFTNFEKKQKRNEFNLNIRPRINLSSLKIENTGYNTLDTDFGSNISFGLGLEAEYILPFNRNKWSLLFEPTYQYFKINKTYSVNNVSGGKLHAKVDYSSFEFPISVREYFFLKNKSKIFVNASYIFDINLKSSIEFTRIDGSNYKTLDISARNNMALGIGYKQKDKYSLEIRYQTSRHILGSYPYWSSKFNTLSVIFGYSLFSKSSQ